MYLWYPSQCWKASTALNTSHSTVRTFSRLLKFAIDPFFLLSLLQDGTNNSSFLTFAQGVVFRSMSNRRKPRGTWFAKYFGWQVLVGSFRTNFASARWSKVPCFSWTIHWNESIRWWDNHAYNNNNKSSYIAPYIHGAHRRIIIKTCKTVPPIQ